ncbi:hypothetical protein CS022_03210 [Veronia nyctiphanis]|uniref:DUF2878 domain-containing protein n=1 Tax=Veronia nyctiphanis TaxID=1278244 RepID=A0A4Q0YTM8_9GAMM|nr:DUF2878 domain-containing protein [Veronia nyctiphanis]RXJ74590.1 hypothetical protein CS022_03210 [Veronia nyctiphanis]
MGCTSFALVGIGGDTALMYSGVLGFSGSMIPVWLMLLWAGFVAYIWLVRDWLLTKPRWLLVLIGGIGGAMSYLGGYRLNAVDFPYGVIESAAALFVVWVIYSAVYLALINRSRVGVTA